MRARALAIVATLALVIGAGIAPANAQGGWNPVSVTGAQADGIGAAAPAGELGDVNVYIRDTATNGTCAQVKVQGKRQNGETTSVYTLGNQSCTTAWVLNYFNFADNVELFRYQACNVGGSCSSWSSWGETNYV